MTKTDSQRHGERGCTKVDYPTDCMVRGSICDRGKMFNFPQNVQTGLVPAQSSF